MRKLIGGTDPGLVRSSNQDRYEMVQLSPTLAFAVLCDGMGGEKGGNVASDLAATHAKEALLRELSENMTEATLRGILQTVVAGANALVYETAQKNENLAGMGTTMIVAVFSGEHLYVACVGDSRVYCVSPGKEQQLSRDHTVVQMLVDIGEITEEAARNHPKRHFITRAVGVSPTVDVDFLAELLEAEDIVLLCSDGLYNYLIPGSYHELLHRCLTQDSVQILIDLAKAGGGSDNITAVVAK